MVSKSVRLAFPLGRNQEKWWRTCPYNKQYLERPMTLDNVQTIPQITLFTKMIHAFNYLHLGSNKRALVSHLLRNFMAKKNSNFSKAFCSTCQQTYKTSWYSWAPLHDMWNLLCFPHLLLQTLAFPSTTLKLICLASIANITSRPLEALAPRSSALALPLR